MAEFADPINLRTLQQICESIDDIIFSAGQVAVYKYCCDINEWQKKEVEGSMFLVSRSTDFPQHAFVVINRLNTTNMIQWISSSLETKLQEPYLLYKNQNNDIFCIWFYNEQNCVKLWRKIQEISSQREKNDVNDVNDDDLRNSWLMMKEAIATNSKAPASNRNSTQHNNNKTSSSSAKNSNVSHANNENPIMVRLLSKDGNKNAGTPNDTNVNNKTPVGTNGSQKQTQQQPSRQGRSVQVQDLFAGLSVGSKAPQELPQSDPIANDVITPAMLLTDAKPDVTNMFPQRPQVSPTIGPQSQSFPLIPSAPAFGPNLMLPHIERSGIVLTPLTMEQLKQALVYLLQNDADFLHSIHSAYTNSILHKK